MCLVRQGRTRLLALHCQVCVLLYCGYRRSCGLLYTAQGQCLSVPLVGLPAATAVDCKHTDDPDLTSEEMSQLLAV